MPFYFYDFLHWLNPPFGRYVLAAYFLFDFYSYDRVGWRRGQEWIIVTVMTMPMMVDECGMQHNNMCINFMSWSCKCMVWLETNLLNDTRSSDEGDVCCAACNLLIIANNWQVWSLSDGYRYWYENMIIIIWWWWIDASFFMLDLLLFIPDIQYRQIR